MSDTKPLKFPVQKQGLPSKTSFVFTPVKVANKLRYVARTTCIVCGGALDVVYGSIMATFIVGTEFVGVAHDECLNEESQAALTRVREQAAREQVSK
jgi:hypothetical protein